MNEERLRQIEDLCNLARKREPGERSGFLAEACRGDEELRSKVELLLAEDVSNDDASSLLGQPGNARLTPGMQIGPYKIEALLGTVEVWTRRGLQRFIVLFFIELSSVYQDVGPRAFRPR
jgi:hypothetical protein